MGCGASKKGNQESSATKKSDNNGDNKEKNDQQADQAGQNEQNEQNQNVEDNTRKKTKKKKGTTKQTGGGLAGAGEGGNDGELDMLKKNDYLELSNLDDMPEYRGDNPKFNFRDGELSPIDESNRSTMMTTKRDNTRKHGSQNLNSFEQEVISKFNTVEPKAKKIKVKRHKTSDFNWPDRGELEIKTISYKVVYNHEIKGFRTVKSKDQYITSLLTWSKNEEDDLYNFGIKDIAVTNLRSGNSTEIVTPQMNFDVDIDGKFLGIKELDKFVENVLSLQSTGKVTQSKQSQLQKTILEELEKAWNLMVQEWVYLSKPENQELIVDVREQYGRECALLHKVTSTDDEEYRGKLKEKLLDANSYYKILSSNKMIRDNYRKWELHKDSTVKPKNAAGELIQPHRNMKLNFIYTDKDEVFTVLNEPSTVRPLMTNYENSKKIVFEVNRDIYIDVEYESRMSIYMWKGIEELRSDEFLIKEMVKFQDSCNVALGDILADLSNIQRIPLKFRVGPTVSEKKAEQEPEPMGDGETFGGDDDH